MDKEVGSERYLRDGPAPVAGLGLEKRAMGHGMQVDSRGTLDRPHAPPEQNTAHPHSSETTAFGPSQPGGTLFYATTSRVSVAVVIGSTRTCWILRNTFSGCANIRGHT